MKDTRRASANGWCEASELCSEAIGLGRMLVELIPGRGEPKGLLALVANDAERRYLEHRLGEVASGLAG